MTLLPTAWLDEVGVGWAAPEPETSASPQLGRQLLPMTWLSGEDCRGYVAERRGIDPKVGIPYGRLWIEVPDMHGAGHVQVVVQATVKRDLVEARPGTVRCADLDDLRARLAECQVRQPRAVWADDALGPVKQRDLPGQWHALQTVPLEAEWVQGS